MERGMNSRLLDKDRAGIIGVDIGELRLEILTLNVAV